MECDIRFTEDTITVRITPPHSKKPSAPQSQPLSPHPPATVEDVPDEDSQPLFQHNDDGESKVKVEGELQPATPTPELAPTHRTMLPHAMQPTCQSSRIRKPSAKVRQIQAGEGTPDGGTGNYTTEQLTFIAGSQEEEHAYLASLNNVEALDPAVPQGDPRNVKEAMACPDWPHRKEAMDHEYKSLKYTWTWRTVDCPPSCNIVSCQWVFRLKSKANGSIDKYKARLVACGFLQVPGLNYTDTYAPVVHMASFQTILALAACQDWDINAFNFNSAYLNGELGNNKEIYMEEPPRYETPEEDSVKHLQKAIYGLKQAGRKWYDTVTCMLTDIGFCVSSADPRVFVACKGEHVLILAAHVDNCIITGSSLQLIK